MKLRIRDNSIRLRLTKTEVNRLDTEGSVRSRVNFPGGESLCYEVESSPACVAPVARFEKSCVTVRLPATTVTTWATSDKVSIADEQQISPGDVLSILVEKDFACLAPRAGEDESDMFEHPRTGEATC
jgi:hypothetical protein